MIGGMSYEIRPVRAREWREIRDLRMYALQDEIAPLAFLSTYEQESRYTDDFWRDRARTSSVDFGAAATARQFVAVDGGSGDDAGSDGAAWAGTAVGLIERTGTRDYASRTITHDGIHVVGVYLRPAHRGTGLIGLLMDAVLGWASERDLTRARLYVHADNHRAQAAYRKLGFVATGETFTGAMGPELEMSRTL